MIYSLNSIYSEILPELKFAYFKKYTFVSYALLEILHQIEFKIFSDFVYSILWILRQWFTPSQPFCHLVSSKIVRNDYGLVIVQDDNVVLLAV